METKREGISFYNEWVRQFSIRLTGSCRGLRNSDLTDPVEHVMQLHIAAVRTKGQESSLQTPPVVQPRRELLSVQAS